MALRTLQDVSELDEPLHAEQAVLFKHSTHCPTSARALKEVERFASQDPDTPVYLVDVVRDRFLSRQISERLGIRHASPQAIVLRRGRPAWHASHYRITARALLRETAGE
jgi:bacillithiol system protein YtxJ